MTLNYLRGLHHSIVQVDAQLLFAQTLAFAAKQEWVAERLAELRQQVSEMEAHLEAPATVGAHPAAQERGT